MASKLLGSASTFMALYLLQGPRILGSNGEEEPVLASGRSVRKSIVHPTFLAIVVPFDFLQRLN